MTDCDTELRTSTSGDSPVTVSDSSMAPTCISALMVAVNAAESLIPSRRTVLKPESVKVTTYSPGLRSVIWYWPLASVIVTREPSINAGLETSTTTPGSTPPEESRTTPAIELAICADAAAGIRRSRLAVHQRTLREVAEGRGHFMGQLLVKGRPGGGGRKLTLLQVSGFRFRVSGSVQVACNLNAT
jgi:hypothetical protein